VLSGGAGPWAACGGGRSVLPISLSSSLHLPHSSLSPLCRSAVGRSFFGDGESRSGHSGARSGMEEVGRALIWRGGAPRSGGRDSSGFDWAWQRARLGLLGFFLFFKSINGGGHLNATTSVNRLTEAAKATASKKVGLAVTFDWRRLKCPPPLIVFACLH
jgi:hypothetical protein